MLNTAESSKTLALLAEGFTEALVTAMMVKNRDWRCCKTLAICCALVIRDRPSQKMTGPKAGYIL
jgi:hypothetical protein